MKIILVNGCPGTGKDEIFKIMSERRAGKPQILEKMKFAQPLDDITRGVLPPMSDEVFMQLREPDKDRPFIIKNGELHTPSVDEREGATTMRKLLIGISENLIKPHFGNTYFGQVAAAKVLARIEKLTDAEWSCSNNCLVFTDSGFQVEYDKFKSIMRLHHIPTELIQIRRPGKTFEGDSREHVNDKIMWHIFNNEGLDELRQEIHQVMDRIGI